MAELVSKLILDVIQADCPALSCPYRQGDGVHRKQVAKRLDTKVKHRVADGNEVRVLERKLEEVMIAAKRALEAAERGRKLNPQEIAHLRKVLQSKKENKAT